MGWFFSKPSDNELGEYLPDEEAQPYEQTEPIQAESRPEAEEICKDTAAKYGGTEPSVEKLPGSEKDYDCKFKLWG